MAKPKAVDTVSMDFTDSNAANKGSTNTGTPGEIVYNVPAQPAIDPGKDETEAGAKTATKTFEHDGGKVYEVDTEGRLYTFFDSDGNPLDDNLVENLRLAYPPVPDQDDLGTNKAGPLVIREVDDKNQTPQDANFSGTVTMVTERQNYESGQAFTKTILKKYYNIVRVLRGEIGISEEEGKSGQGEVEDKSSGESYVEAKEER